MALIKWPKGLSLFMLRKIFYARHNHRLIEVQAELQNEGVEMTSDELFQLCDEIEAASKELGVFVLDGHRKPNALDLPRMPQCVLSTREAVYLDYHNMQLLIALYDGENLNKEELGLHRWGEMLEAQRRQFVLCRSCKGYKRDVNEQNVGCPHNNDVVVTVGMAVRAIRKHRLLEKGDVYDPPRLCQACSKKRNEALAESRAQGHKMGVSVSEMSEWKTTQAAMADVLKAAKKKKKKKLTETVPPNPVTPEV